MKEDFLAEEEEADAAAAAGVEVEEVEVEEAGGHQGSGRRLSASDDAWLPRYSSPPPLQLVRGSCPAQWLAG